MAETPGVSMNVHVTEDNFGPAMAALARQIKNLDAAYDEIGASNVTETQMRFELEVDPEGRKWVALSDVTLAKKEAEGRTPRKLRESTELYDSLAHRVLPQGGGTQIGVTRVYGRIHQLGGMAGRNLKVQIPARPYLGVSAQGREEIFAILNDHLKVQ